MSVVSSSLENESASFETVIKNVGYVVLATLSLMKSDACNSQVTLKLSKEPQAPS
jgi:hypothetical protein